MKRTLNSILGLALLILATSATTLASASTKPANKPVYNFNIKQTDSYFIFFGLQATETSTPGLYDLKVTYNFYDATLGISYGGDCPENVSITMNDYGGPFYGAEFTFPSGASSLDLGDYYLNPEGNDYAIITAPTTLGSYEVSQYLIAGHIM
jgi:hypothetical protein